MKYCPYCHTDKPFFPQEKSLSKASGFRGQFCWDCRTIANRQATAKHRTANPNNSSEANCVWAKRNPGKTAAQSMERRAAKLDRIVPWTEHDEIEKFYKEASSLELTVDHIVPLRGREVSGLHVLANLQMLTQSENSAKGNRFKQ